MIANLVADCAQMLTVRPICHRCRKPVESFTGWYDSFYDQYHFLVVCHGAIEECDVDAKLVRNAEQITMGEAFIPKDKR